MYPTDPGNTRAALTAHVRRSAGSAAIAALLMCAYGFGMLAAPDPKDMFTWSNWVFFYTLRIGGLGMGGVAIAGVAGWGASLTIGGVLSLLIGVSFMLTGVGMLVGGGAMFNSVLITLFGWLFAGTGWRDLRTAQYFATPATSAHRTDLEPPADAVTRDDRRQAPTTPSTNDSPTGQLINRLANRQADAARSGESFPVARRKDAPSNPPADPTPEPTTDATTTTDPPAPPGGGFLADLGRKGRPPGV